jgi:hypothetical protein
MMQPFSTREERRRMKNIPLRTKNRGVLSSTATFGLLLCLVLFLNLGSAQAFISPNHGRSRSHGVPSSSIRNNAEGASDSEKMYSKDDGYDGLGEYDPSENLRPQREVLVGDPQLKLKEKERSVTSILKELAAIQQQGPQKYCILGTRHCSYLHQQIIELLYVEKH